MAFIEQCVHELPYMTAPNISAVHAFTTRHGGVSQGVLASLNLGLTRGDSLDALKENYRRICRILQISDGDIVRRGQIHGTCVEVVTHRDCGDIYSADKPKADGLITNVPGIALMVYAADCVPMLLCDAETGVVGAVHAGWRGTALDIAGEAVRKMESVFGCRNISAAIGPSISKCCFETDGDVPSALHKSLGNMAGSCVERLGEKFMVDLKAANRLMLLRAGVLPENIIVSDECTSCSCDKYWSHRRTNGDRGSQAAIIVLRGTDL